MKIYYINGYNGFGKSTKNVKLTELLGEPVILAEYRYEDNNIEEIRETVKDADLIISASTGSYIARKICWDYNIPLVSLNPVIDLERTFKKLNVKVPDIEGLPNNRIIEELILCNNGDELIDCDKTKELFPNSIILPGGDHRFSNLEDAIPYINEFKNHLMI